MKIKYALPVLLLGILLWLTPSLPQDPAYHNFVDQRAMWGIPNAFDVLSNLPFLFFGLYGLWICLKNKTSLERKLPEAIFFIGAFLVGFGSAYYHWRPNSTTLFWDRLPMTISFMSLLSMMLADEGKEKLGFKLLPVFLAIGLFSVLYWRWTDDLRPYALVQFGPMLWVPWKLWQRGWSQSKYLWGMIAFYVGAKVLEFADRGVFHICCDAVSGHSLKHVCASFAIVMVALDCRNKASEKLDKNDN
jgi:hypothetical protein